MSWGAVFFIRGGEVTFVFPRFSYSTTSYTSPVQSTISTLIAGSACLLSWGPLLREGNKTEGISHSSGCCLHYVPPQSALFFLLHFPESPVHLPLGTSLPSPPCNTVQQVLSASADGFASPPSIHNVLSPCHGPPLVAGPLVVDQSKLSPYWSNPHMVIGWEFCVVSPPKKACDQPSLLYQGHRIRWCASQLNLTDRPFLTYFQLCSFLCQAFVKSLPLLHPVSHTLNSIPQPKCAKWYRWYLLCVLVEPSILLLISIAINILLK